MKGFMGVGQQGEPGERASRIAFPELLEPEPQVSGALHNSRGCSARVRGAGGVQLLAAGPVQKALTQGWGCGTRPHPPRAPHARRGPAHPTRRQVDSAAMKRKP
jgi:hypothetical protein